MEAEDALQEPRADKAISCERGITLILQLKSAASGPHRLAFVKPGD